MGFVDVHLTISPDKKVRIHEGDVPQLAHQGLLHGDPVPVPAQEEEPDGEAPGPVPGHDDKAAGKPRGVPRTSRAALTEGTSS